MKNNPDINVNSTIFFFTISIVCCFEIFGGFLYQWLKISPIFLTGLVRICETIIIVRYIINIEGHCQSIGCGRSQINSGIYFGMIWSLIFGIIVFTIFFLFGFIFRINLFHMIKMPLPDTFTNQVCQFLVGCIIGPFAEELVFRGVIYGFFRKWGIIIACCFSTLIFVFLHLNAPVIPLTQIIGGILFAVSYEHTKMLTTPITIHILGNSCMLFLSYFQINL